MAEWARLTRRAWDRALERRDGLVAVTGGVVLWAVGAWWTVQAFRADHPPDAPGGESLAAEACFAAGTCAH